MALKSTFGLAAVNHNYTAEERQILNSYQSLEYLPPHSKVYRNWLQQQPARLDWDRWLMMGLIGFSVGILGFLLHQIIDLISEVKWEKTKEFIQSQEFTQAWCWTFGYSLIFLVVSSLLVIYQPAAAGSGIPEIIGFLNGTRIKDIFKVQTLIVKFLSCAFAVGCGMPVGYEGPMIHLGSLVAAGMSQFKSATFECSMPCFSRFRNSEDRRNFISAGAAAGIASAFGAPVGGLLFAMEEVSSFWKNKLSWQVFFCCMTATFTTDLLNSSFHGFKYKNDFGLFKTKFTSKDLIAVNVIAVLPSILMGIGGGILGSGFTHVNIVIGKCRKMFMSKIKDKAMENLIKLLEPILILAIMSTIHIFLPGLLGCTPLDCNYSTAPQTHTLGYETQRSNECFPTKDNDSRTEINVVSYTCNLEDTPIYSDSSENGTQIHRRGSYSESATLFFGTGEQAVYHLFSKHTHKQFSYASMSTMLVIYFLVACWSAGTHISSGLVVPMLLIGGLYGRMVGCLFVDQFGIQHNKYWAWMDPGAFALLGSVSFFGGVTRLTMSLTVIMVEITNDIHQLLLIMITIMVAKWTGDFLSHPLYHALLEFKCIPFLGHEPMLIKSDGSVLNLDLFTAQDAMSSPVKTVNMFASVHSICKVLLGCTHCGFPVVKSLGAGLENTFCGEITRLELRNLMTRPELFIRKTDFNATVRMPHVSDIMHPHFRVSKKSPHLATDELLQQYVNEETYSDYFVNLSPYINDSGVCVPQHFSLHRAYILFRTLGLRHMTVVTPTNQIHGILTRKDLMGFAIEERLERLLTNPPRKLSRSVVLALRKNYGHKHSQKKKSESSLKQKNGKSNDNNSIVNGPEEETVNLNHV
ncbi:chloride channel protein C-like [Lepeophtheirus salmonis]|uniref:chloride channel protein C-like n=1 Tax=Lepeophtheirus salmonis TaxID=72036 RepID=UPI001AE1CD52|nr:chloride transport protein 6-like [Lepeophtheirus salmonis]